MSAPTQSNAAYKKRLISAMLDEPAFHDVSGPPPKAAKSWSPKLVSAVAGLALLSAAAVFLLLFHRDTPQSVLTTLVGPAEKKIATSSLVAKVPLAPNSGDGAGAKIAVPTGARTSLRNDSSFPARFEFKLRRSRNYQQIGTVEMRLLRVNLKRGTCDVSVRFADRHTLQKRAKLDKPLQFKSALSSEVFELSISTTARDSVSGSLSTLSAASNNAKQQ